MFNEKEIQDIEDIRIEMEDGTDPYENDILDELLRIKKEQIDRILRTYNKKQIDS